MYCSLKQIAFCALPRNSRIFFQLINLELKQQLREQSYPIKQNNALDCHCIRAGNSTRECRLQLLLPRSSLVSLSVPLLIATPRRNEIRFDGAADEASCCACGIFSIRAHRVWHTDWHLRWANPDGTNRARSYVMKCRTQLELLILLKRTRREPNISQHFQCKLLIAVFRNSTFALRLSIGFAAIRDYTCI